MEKIASYSDEKLLREHPVVMQRLTLSNATAQPIHLERGSVIGLDGDGLKGLFATGMTEVAGVLAESASIPAKSGSNPGEAHAAVYVHADFVLDQLKFAASATETDKALALAALQTIGCYAS